MKSRGAITNSLSLAVEPTDFERFLAEPVETDATPSSRPRQGSVGVGTLAALRADGVPLVTYPGQVGGGLSPARATTDVGIADIGRSVVLAFDRDDQSPIILGCIRQDGPGARSEPENHVEIEADGTRLKVSAQEQLVLRCGSASITLTKAGKVLIQGTYVSCASSGLNRVKGAAVQIN